MLMNMGIVEFGQLRRYTAEILQRKIYACISTYRLYLDDECCHCSVTYWLVEASPLSL